MRVALIACAFLGAAFMLHWCLWRVWVPRRQTLALLGIFMGVMVFGCALCAQPFARDLGCGLDWPWEYLQVVMFHVAMTLGYIIAYSAIEHRSPSMTILTFVADAKGAGRSRREVEELLGEDSPLELRIAAMLRDGMVRRVEDGLLLTGKGARWATVFGGWARLIGLGKGG